MRRLGHYGALGALLGGCASSEPVTSSPDAGKPEISGIDAGTYDAAAGGFGGNCRAVLVGGEVAQLTYVSEFVDGKEVSQLQATAPGLDGQWGTADDVIESAHTQHYDAQGRLAERRHYDSAGMDGTWLTEDDHFHRRDVFEYPLPGQHRVLLYRGGPDSVAGTADDVLHEWQAHFENAPTPTSADPEDRHFIYYSKPGPDGQWFTPDDESRGWQYYEFLDAGRRREYFVFDPGADGVFLTSDDVAKSMNLLTCSPSQGLASYEWFEPGGDGAFGTPDDVHTATSPFTFDSCGVLICQAVVH